MSYQPRENFMTATLSTVSAEATSRDFVAEFLAAHPIGSPRAGGFFAGLYTDNRYAVIVADKSEESPKRLTFSQAVKFAAACRAGGLDDWQAGDRDALYIANKRLNPTWTIVESFKDGADQAFEQNAYWTHETHPVYSDCAWGQDFGSGGSYDWLKYGVLRVRPVRIIPISSI